MLPDMLIQSGNAMIFRDSLIAVGNPRTLTGVIAALANAQEKVAHDKRALEAERSSRQHLTGAAPAGDADLTSAQSWKQPGSLSSLFLSVDVPTSLPGALLSLVRWVVSPTRSPDKASRVRSAHSVRTGIGIGVVIMLSARTV